MSWLPDWLTGYDAANAQRAAAADAELRRLNQQKIDAGVYGPAVADQIAANYAAQDAQGGFSLDSQRNSIDQAFADGINDGRANTNSFLWGLVSQILKSVPSVFWVALAVFLFWKFGGFKKLSAKFA